MAIINIVLLTILICGAAYGQETLFNVDKEMCCNKQVFPKPDGQDMMPMCCGDNPMLDIRKELCCANKTVQLPPEALVNTDADENSTMPFPIPLGGRPGMIPYMNFPNYACCGESTFNFDTDLCCEDTVIPKPATNGASFDPMTGGPTTFWGCCGKQILNVTSQACCRGKIIEITSPTESCCGDRLVDNAKEICCVDDFLDENEEPNVIPREHSDIGCCGRNSIDYKKEICCLNKIVPLPEESKGIMACCGENLWQPAGSDEICCNDKIVKMSGPISCCQSETYNYENEVCCDGHVQPRTTNTTFCCGQATFDPETKNEACCYSSGKIIPIVDQEKRFCCD